MFITRRSFIRTGLIFVPTVFSAGLHGAVRYGNMDPKVGDWIGRVRTAGGTATGLSVVANDQFMKIATAGGLRSTLYRVNTYTGLDLTTCLVPLINTYGGTTDSNGFFVAGDYSESTGLTGDGSTNYLNTGLVMTSLPDVNSGSMCAYIRTNSQESKLTMGVGAGGSASAIGYLYIRDVGDLIKGVWFNELGASTTGTDSRGLFQISRTASNAIALYRNGSSIATDTGSAGSFTPTIDLYIHAWNNVLFGARDYTARTLAGYGVNSGHTATQALAYYNAWQRLQTILGRQV
ncbi:MAG: hypothetical protein V4563_14495 [Pseudomonadota bacterium]